VPGAVKSVRSTPSAPATARAKAASGPAANRQPPRLDRERRVLAEAERLQPVALETDERLLRSARTGREELREALREHTETSPELTGGDIDAKWEDAYAVGDEAPGGDNPTPDQDRVEDIGRALGVTYEDNEELKGADKIAERDRKRWEYDPASSDDWPRNK
jgi:hypothetical protein